MTLASREAVPNATLGISLTGGLVDLEGRTQFSIGISSLSRSPTEVQLNLSYSGDGPFGLLAELPISTPLGVYTAIGQALFHIRPDGTLAPGPAQSMHTPPRPIEAREGLQGAATGAGDACTVTFTVRIEAGAVQVPVAFQGFDLEGLEVQLLDSGGGAVPGQIGTTNDFGEVTFNPNAATCTPTYSIEVSAEFYHSGKMRVEIRDWNDGNKVFTQTANLGQVQNGQPAYVVAMPAAMSSAGVIMSYAARGFEIVQSTYTGADDIDKVDIYWSLGMRLPECDPVPAPCVSSYVWTPDPAAPNPHIRLNGQPPAQWDEFSVGHEYGHHIDVDFQNYPPSLGTYGSHDCGPTACHRWDSVHATLKSALAEGWGNFWAARVVDRAEIASVGIDLDNPDEGRSEEESEQNLRHCWGPYRECAVAGALWDLYASNAGTGKMLSVLSTNPQGIHKFFQGGGAYGWSPEALRGNRISDFGDGYSYGDAGSNRATAVEIPTFADIYADISNDVHPGNPDREDWYRFEANDGQLITVDVFPNAAPGWPSDNQDYEMRLYDAGGALLVDSLDQGGIIRWVADHPPSGSRNVLRRSLCHRTFPGHLPSIH